MMLGEGWRTTSVVGRLGGRFDRLKDKEILEGKRLILNSGLKSGLIFRHYCHYRYYVGIANDRLRHWHKEIVLPHRSLEEDLGSGANRGTVI